MIVKALEGGLTVEAAVDFTGGIPEMIDITRIPRGDYKYLFDYMKKADDKQAFMSCSLSVRALLFGEYIAGTAAQQQTLKPIFVK